MMPNFASFFQKTLGICKNLPEQFDNNILQNICKQNIISYYKGLTTITKANNFKTSQEHIDHGTFRVKG